MTHKESFLVLAPGARTLPSVTKLKHRPDVPTLLYQISTRTLRDSHLDHDTAVPFVHVTYHPVLPHIIRHHLGSRNTRFFLSRTCLSNPTPRTTAISSFTSPVHILGGALQTITRVPEGVDKRRPHQFKHSLEKDCLKRSRRWWHQKSRHSQHGSSHSEPPIHTSLCFVFRKCQQRWYFA